MVMLSNATLKICPFDQPLVESSMYIFRSPLNGLGLNTFFKLNLLEKGTSLDQTPYWFAKLGSNKFVEDIWLTVVLDAKSQTNESAITYPLTLLFTLILPAIDL